MASTHEQVLAALFADLQTLQTSTVNVYRNIDKPLQVNGGMIILRDGDSEEPEVLLSPLTYIYQHLVHMEVLVQNAVASAHDTMLDSLLVSIGGIIDNNRSLGGLAEWMEANAPAFIEEPVDGAPTIKMAQFSIMVRFFTSDPLN